LFINEENRIASWYRTVIITIGESFDFLIYIYIAEIDENIFHTSIKVSTAEPNTYSIGLINGIIRNKKRSRSFLTFITIISLIFSKAFCFAVFSIS
jgi:hypothetical protein